jgi:hypothetical protein
MWTPNGVTPRQYILSTEGMSMNMGNPPFVVYTSIIITNVIFQDTSRLPLGQNYLDWKIQTTTQIPFLCDILLERLQ